MAAGLQKSRYFKAGYSCTNYWIASLLILYYCLPVSIEIYLVSAVLLTMTMKSIKKSQFSPFPLLDREDKEQILLQRLNIQLIRLNWLVNKFTKECLQYSLAILGCFYLIDWSIHPSLSIWITAFLANAYFSLTKLARNEIKYRLGLFKDYKKYVIHIIEPNANEQREESDLQAALQEFKQL